MDDTEKEKQHLLYNEKRRERYARKRQHMMDTKINNEHKIIKTKRNLGSPTVSKQYRPSEVENEQLAITSFNFHSIENDMPQISQNQMDYISCEHGEVVESQKIKNCTQYSVQQDEHNARDMEQRVLEGRQSGNMLERNVSRSNCRRQYLKDYRR